MQTIESYLRNTFVLEDTTALGCDDSDEVDTLCRVIECSQTQTVTSRVTIVGLFCHKNGQGQALPLQFYFNIFVKHHARIAQCRAQSVILHRLESRKPQA